MPAVNACMAFAPSYRAPGAAGSRLAHNVLAAVQIAGIVSNWL